jgi:hypothetical protein
MAEEHRSYTLNVPNLMSESTIKKLIGEGRWTPKAFQRFGYEEQAPGIIAYPISAEVKKIYDLNKSENRWHIAGSGSKKAKLIGNLNLEELLLCEGESDACAMYELGFENIAFGTAGAGTFNKDWLDGSNVKRILVAYDSDSAGIRGAKKIITILNSMGILTKFISLPNLPDTKDLRDLIIKHNYSKEDFNKLFDSVTWSGRKKHDLVLASDVETVPIEWICKPYIPLAFTTLFTGDPGIGKSTTVGSIVSAITNPSEKTIWNIKKHGNVLWYTAEETPEHNIRPRLEKMYAELSKVQIYPHRIEFSDNNLQEIRKHIEVSKPVLVIIDPVQAFFESGSNSNDMIEVRSFMARLQELANEFQIAILAIRHSSKGTKEKLLYSGIGSIDFSGAARSEIFMAINPLNEQQRIIGLIKSNFVAAEKEETFVVSTDNGVINLIEKNQFPISKYFAEATKANLRPSPALNEAKDFLNAVLTNGPMLATEVSKKADEAGVSKRTLQRAKEGLVKSYLKSDAENAWYWKLIDPVEALLEGDCQ